MSEDFTRRAPAFPSHGSMGERATPGISIAMLMTAHTAQGLIAGTVARNGAEVLRDSDAQGELAELAITLSDRIVSAVNADLERQRWDWTQRLADRRLKALQQLLFVATELHGCLPDDDGAQAIVTAALTEAHEAIEDDDIPF